MQPRVPGVRQALYLGQSGERGLVIQFVVLRLRFVLLLGKPFVPHVYIKYIKYIKYYISTISVSSVVRAG